MKYIKFIALFILLTGCSHIILHKIPKIPSLYGLKSTGDSLIVDFKLDIPQKTLSKKVIYSFNPILVINGQDTISLDEKVIIGEKVPGDESKIKYSYGGSFMHSDTVALSQKIKTIEIYNISTVKTNGEDWGISLAKEIIFEGEFSKNTFAD